MTVLLEYLTDLDLNLVQNMLQDQSDSLWLVREALSRFLKDTLKYEYLKRPLARFFSDLGLVTYCIFVWFEEWGQVVSRCIPIVIHSLHLDTTTKLVWLNIKLNINFMLYSM